LHFSVLFISSRFNFLKNLLVGLAWERSCCCGDDVKKHSEGPNVTALIVIFLEDLRRNIVGCSHNLVGTCCFKLAPHFFFPVEGQPEVDEHDVVIVCAAEEEVLSLEISVTYFLEVKVFDCLDHL